MGSGIGRRLRNYVIAGTIALIPLTITYFTLSFLFHLFDRSLLPVFMKLLTLTGLTVTSEAVTRVVGLAATVTTVLLVGVMTRNFVGRAFMNLGERALYRIPLVSSVYFASKQLVQAFSVPGRKAFRKVVMLEYPRRGIHSVGFVTNERPTELGGEVPGLLRAVFVPTSPNPTSGVLLLAPPEELHELPITVEEGIKLVVSGGILMPEALRTHGTKVREPDNGPD